MKHAHIWLGLTAAGLMACGELTRLDDLAGAIDDSAAAEAPAPTAQDLAPATAGLLMLHSDYSSTQISALSTNGTLVRPNFLHSGTEVRNLSTALSGDVVLPSQPSAVTMPVVIDRSNGVITVLDADTLAVVRQFSVGNAGYGANPYDFVAQRPSKAYVTRFGFEGQDVAIVNPINGVLAGTIDLSDQATQAEGTTDPTSSNPASLLLVGDYLYVTLLNQTNSFVTGRTGLVWIDTRTDTLAGSLLLEKKNCSGMVYARHVSEVIVGCGGAFSDADQATGSGIIVLDVSQPDAPAVTRTVHAKDIGDGLPVSGSLSWLGGQTVASVVNGSNDWETGENLRPEQLYAIDTSAPATEAYVLEETGDAFVYTTGSDVRHGKLYLGVGSFATPGLTAYGLNLTGEVVDTNNVALGDLLPPRSIRGY